MCVRFGCQGAESSMEGSRVSSRRVGLLELVWGSRFSSGLILKLKQKRLSARTSKYYRGRPDPKVRAFVLGGPALTRKLWPVTLGN